MNFFSSATSSFLGVDIGASSIKIVELFNEKGRGRLNTYGYSELKNDNNSVDIEKDPEGRAELIKKIIKKSGATSTSVVTALPTYAVFSSVLTFPARLGKKELPTAIRWEAKKVIPLPIEDMILDWKPLPQTQDFEKKDIPESSYEKKIAKKVPKKEFQKILLTGAPKKLVHRYVTVFKFAGLKLLSLETESFALVRSLVGNDPTPAMLVNFGAMTTTISVIEHAIPMLNRSIDIGGRNITKKIAHSLKISEDKASHFKQDVGLATMQSPHNNTPRIIIDALESVTGEIMYTKNIWQGQFGQKISKIILTGGSANLPGLADYLTKEIGIKTFLGDPWARVSYPEDLKPVLNEVGSKLSVAVGLGMRNIE